MTTAEVEIPKTKNESEPNLTPQEIAQKQVDTAELWAERYEDLTVEQAPKAAEMVLRNPANYIVDIDLNKLPEELQEEWANFLKYCEIVAQQAANPDVDPMTDINAIMKIQELVRDGSYDDEYRGDMAEIIHRSANLFAKSTEHISGNTNYYEANVLSAEASYGRLATTKAS